MSARPRRNVFSNNLVHHSTGDSVQLGNADDNFFNMNSVSPGPAMLSFENASNLVLVANSLPANATVRLNGASINSTTMSLKDHPLVQLEIDAFSTETFEDDAGSIFDLDQGDLATAVDASGSTLAVTLAALGAQTATITTTVVTRNFLVAPDSGTVLINPTLWELSGGLRKEWTTEPVDNRTSGGPTPTAVSATANVQYTVGDLSPNTSYQVSKNGQALSAVTSDSGGHVSFADVPGTTSPVRYAVGINDQPLLPTVTVAATDANASETAPDTGTFTISRTGNATAALTVHYSLRGNAVNGTDYVPLSGSVVIPAGAASATVTVTPIDDAVKEGNETVIFTVSANGAYTVGLLNQAAVNIAANDQPNAGVRVQAADAKASEKGPNPGTFNISRIGDVTSALTVKYSLSGTAANGTDYQQLSGSVTIPAGTNSATVKVLPIDDNKVEGDETVILTLSPDAAYTLATAASDTVTISDSTSSSTQRKPVVSMTASDTVASESGTDTATITISRASGSAAPLTVWYTITGTALNGVDVQTLTGTAFFPSGATSVDVVVRPIDDNLIEGAELVILTLATSDSYNVGLDNTVQITFLDNDLL